MSCGLRNCTGRNMVWVDWRSRWTNASVSWRESSKVLRRTRIKSESAAKANRSWNSIMRLIFWSPAPSVNATKNATKLGVTKIVKRSRNLRFLMCCVSCETELDHDSDVGKKYLRSKDTSWCCGVGQSCAKRSIQIALGANSHLTNRIECCVLIVAHQKPSAWLSLRIRIQMKIRFQMYLEIERQIHFFFEGWFGFRLFTINLPAGFFSTFGELSMHPVPPGQTTFSSCAECLQTLLH